MGGAPPPCSRKPGSLDQISVVLMICHFQAKKIAIKQSFRLVEDMETFFLSRCTANLLPLGLEMKFFIIPMHLIDDSYLIFMLCLLTGCTFSKFRM